VTRQYIARLERAGVIKKVARGEYPASTLAEIAAFRAGDPLPGEESPAGLTHERTLLVRAQREKAELDLAERRGELQSRAENEAKAAALATDTRKRLLAVPDRVAGRFGLPREVIEGIAVSNAASSSAGATNNANARSGSMAIRGANGRKARPAPAMASRDGYGTASSSARLVRTTAASSSTRIHSNIVICTSSRNFGAR